MVEDKVRLWSEGLARIMDRRRFLQRAGGTVFAGMAALAAGQAFVRSASAAGAGAGSGALTSVVPRVPRCAPPGPYCNLNGNTSDPNGCHGASCFQHRYNNQILQCRVYYTYDQAGCWTTPDSGGYWTCCDCECGTPRVTTCGCAQFNTGPYPRPDGPPVGDGA